MPDYAIARYLREALLNLCDAASTHVEWSHEALPAPDPKAVRHILEGESLPESQEAYKNQVDWGRTIFSSDQCTPVIRDVNDEPRC